MIALTPIPTIGRAFKSLVGNGSAFGKTLLDSFVSWRKLVENVGG
jgi:hypothetical protein